MEVIPKDVAFATAALTGFNRNRFVLETNGATSAGPTSIIQFTLPSNATLDLKTLRISMDLLTTSATPASGTEIFGKLPADVNSLISSVEVYCGGVQITQSCSEYGTMARVLKIVRSSRDRDGSADALLGHARISATDAVDNVSVILQDFKSFLGESSTRYLPTNLTGDLTIRLTLAPASVLAYKVASQAIGNATEANFADAAARAAAATITYSASNIRATIDTISLGPTYEKMLFDRLSQEEFIACNYKEYYTWSLHGSSGNAHSLRFSLNASSVDALYAVFRDSNYMTPGIKSHAYPGASLTDAHCANAYYFKSFNGSDNSGNKRGSLRYKWTVANVAYPQYDADILDAAADLSLVTNQVYAHDRGHMVTGLPEFNNGKCILPLVLNMPGQSLNVASGYNTKGSNTSFSLEVKGQVPPTAAAASGATASISTFVVAETSAQMRIMGARSVTVSF